MIFRLYLNNFYKHMDRTFTFTTGLTGIIGPNESGKSLITEGIRYALFGSAALRDTAPKDLHVELDFEIAGETYTVVRKGSQARLGDLAIGIKPVNAAIIKLLGYDLQVFDVANSCNQGAVEALSDMRPAERKLMVDRTVGLDALDAVLKHLGDRGNELKSQAMGMKAMLREPVAPVCPEGYRPSAEVKPLADQRLRDTQELAHLRGSLIAEPATPRVRGIPELQILQEAARADVTELIGLRAQMAHAPTSPVKPEKLDFLASEAEMVQNQEARRAHLQLLGNCVAEAFTLEQLDQMTAQWVQFEAWEHYQSHMAKGSLTCPSCEHSWPVAGNIEAVEPVQQPTISRGTIKSERELIGNAARRAAASLALESLPDWADDLRELRVHDAQWSAWERAQEAFSTFNAGQAARGARVALLGGCEERLVDLGSELAVAQAWFRYDAQDPTRARILELGDPSEGLALLQTQLAAAQIHEAAIQAFDRDNLGYQRDLALHTEVAAKSAVYLQARLDVHALKSRIKSFLLPSLNKVASLLLGQMTGGARHSVVVDEDFNIQIDGAAINTLSGSGKAVGNLAIRIALGQILTNRVFSLFMADEVDGSMDTERANYVAEALQRLTGMVKQVLLITHKRPETDHTIELKK